MKIKPISDEWEKEFDIIYDCYFVSKPSTETARNHVKDFVRNLITPQQTAHEAEKLHDLITIGKRLKAGGVTIDQYLERWEGRLQALSNKDVI